MTHFKGTYSIETDNPEVDTRCLDTIPDEELLGDPMLAFREKEIAS